MKSSLKGYLSLLALISLGLLVFAGVKSKTEIDPGEALADARSRIAVSSKIGEIEVSGPHPGLKLMLPTDNREIFGDPSEFYMYTDRTFEGVSSKPWEGGQYGFVRNQKRTQIGVVYTRLHEGMDIRPVRRDSRGEPLDDVRSISDGTVVYVNPSASGSSYGKYVVVRHDLAEGSFFSLYAHLSSAAVDSGRQVNAGDTLGRLGYTGAGINRERAHVHVELNFLLSEDFKSWYGMHFTSPNHHGIYNGFNMTGLDVARFFLEHRKNPNLTMRQFLDGEEPYFTVIAPTKGVPGILKRYPFLGRDLDKSKNAESWEFTFDRAGVPLWIAPSSTKLKYPTVTRVKPVNTNHSYLTMGRLSGSGSSATLSASGSRYIQLISEAF